jgi:rhodanese-related sulfurtransferase
MVEQLSPAAFVRLRSAGELWQLLDVREPWELEIAGIAGTIHIPMAAVPDHSNTLDAKTPVAVLCHSGVRSAHVASLLAARGFARVANITGGIDAWSVQVDTSVPRY